jgi:hypothetical protein
MSVCRWWSHLSANGVRCKADIGLVAGIMQILLSIGQEPNGAALGRPA